MAGPLYFGSPTWTRTRDLRINSPSLYQLSYQGIVQVINDLWLLDNAKIIAQFKNKPQTLFGSDFSVTTPF